MTILNAGFLGAPLVLWAAVAWKCLQAVRASWEFPFVCVGLALLFQLASQVVADLTGGSERFADLIGDRAEQFVSMHLVTLALFWLHLFFLSSARADVLDRARVHREVLILCVGIAAGTAALLLQPSIPIEQLGATGSGQAGGARARFGPGLAPVYLPFYAISYAFFTYATGSSAWYAFTSARVARSHLRVGLIVVGVALLLLMTGIVGRLSVMIAVSAGHPEAFAYIGDAGAGVRIGLPLLFLGVIYPGLRTRLMAARVWIRRFFAFHALRALWREMNRRFPEMTLRVIPSRNVLERAGLRHLARNYYRRVIEIHDGLMEVSRYLDPDTVAVTDSVATTSRHVERALRAQDAGWEPSDFAVDLGIARGAGSLDEDGAALVELGRRLEHDSVLSRA